MLTTCILFRNDQDTLVETLKSISKLDSKIMACNMGSNDHSAYIARKFGAKIKEISGDNAKCRNELASLAETDIIFHINPGERLISGEDEVRASSGNSVLRVLNGVVMTKEIRVYDRRTCKFENPVFETINSKDVNFSDAIIYVDKSTGDQAGEVEKWAIKNPVSPEPVYYQSILALTKGDYKLFLERAEKYLFMENQGLAAVMTNYHVALVKALHLNQTQDPIKRILGCLAVNPLMAEFWCLLGDVHYKSKLYDKAEAFYDNAIKLGKQRPKNDMWPLTIPMYGTHPEKMIKSCREIVKGSVTYRTIV